MRLRMEKFYTGSLAVSIRYQLTREQAEARSELGGREGKVKRHYSGIKNSGWGMEARFRDCQDTLTLPTRSSPAASGPGAPGAPTSAAPSSSAYHPQQPSSPKTSTQAELFAGPNNRAQLSYHHGQAQSQIRSHHPALRWNATRPRLRPHPHRLHPDPSPVRRRLHVDWWQEIMSGHR